MGGGADFGTLRRLQKGALNEMDRAVIFLQNGV
jgi:hypothetical protein